MFYIEANQVAKRLFRDESKPLHQSLPAFSIATFFDLFVSIVFCEFNVVKRRPNNDIRILKQVICASILAPGVEQFLLNAILTNLLAE